MPRKALAVSLMQFGGAVGKLTSGNLSSWCLQKKLMKVAECIYKLDCRYKIHVFCTLFCLQRTSLLACTMFMVALLVFVFGAESFRNYSEVNFITGM